MRGLVFVALMLAAPLFASVEAEAQTRMEIDCASGPPCDQTVFGHIDAVGTARLPWVASVAVAANVCFYVLKLSSDGPAIQSVIAPNGTVYRAAANAPARVNPTSMAGWYTVQFDTPPPNREQIFQVQLSQWLTSQCSSATPGR
jgi:hypothetical protein